MCSDAFTFEGRCTLSHDLEVMCILKKKIALVDVRVENFRRFNLTFPCSFPRNKCCVFFVFFPHVRSMRIEQLQMYRDNGITTLAEGQEFEIAKRRRQEEVSCASSLARMWDC